MGPWSSGGAMQACRRGDVCLKSFGVLEAGCRCVDVEVFVSRDLELGRHAAGLGRGGLEVRCRRCLFASRALEVWRCDAGV